MKPIQVALVGFGLSGRYLQAPFFDSNPDFHLKKVMTSQEALHAAFPKVEQVRSLAEILADDSIDLVSISSPNETHFDYARQCLLAGKHVLVEKPFTATVLEAETLIDLAQKQGKHLFVFQNRRFDSDFLTVKKILESGQLGDLLRFEANFNRLKLALNVKKWKEDPAPSNGILYDLGAHLIDQCIALFGAPKAVQGDAYTQRPGSTIDDTFDIWLDYGLLKVYLSASLMVPDPTPRYILRGTKGAFVKYGIDQQEDQLKAGKIPGEPGFGEEPAANDGILYLNLDKTPSKTTVQTQKGDWQGLFQNIADVILRDAKPAIPIEEILAQLRVMAQIRRKA